MLTMYLLLAHICTIVHAPDVLIALFHALFLTDLLESIYGVAKDFVEINFN